MRCPPICIPASRSRAARHCPLPPAASHADDMSSDALSALQSAVEAAPAATVGLKHVLVTLKASLHDDGEGNVEVLVATLAKQLLPVVAALTTAATSATSAAVAAAAAAGTAC